MRLVRLSVERFQCIESAELEFGPGLNVLYGPNDIGKSSLAWAVRAVLLLQHNSSQHERFVSWHGGGEPPRVALTFADTETGIGGSPRRSVERGSLEPRGSKDGRTFTGDVNGRQGRREGPQDARLGRQCAGEARWRARHPRRVLDPGAAGRTGQRQQDPVRLVARGDPDESGRARLTEALGALAQDPVFKQILDRAQAQTTRRSRRPVEEEDRSIAVRRDRRTDQGSRARARRARGEGPGDELAEARIRRAARRARRHRSRAPGPPGNARLTTERFEVQRKRGELREQIGVHEASTLRGPRVGPQP